MPPIVKITSKASQLSLLIEGQDKVLADKVNVVNKSTAYLSAIAEIRAILGGSNDQSINHVRGRN